MEFEKNESELWLWRLPIIGPLGKRAVEQFGTQQALKNIEAQIDIQQEQEVVVIESTLPLVSDDMLPVQARTLAAIKAKTLLRHMTTDHEDVADRLEALQELMATYPKDCMLEKLGLEFEEAEALRIKLKEIE